MCHNSFRAGLKKYGSDAEELCLNLYYFISKSPARREDLLVIEEALGLDELVLLRHVQSRWLSLVPALQHVISMKAALVKQKYQLHWTWSVQLRGHTVFTSST